MSFINLLLLFVSFVLSAFFLVKAKKSFAWMIVTVPVGWVLLKILGWVLVAVVSTVFKLVVLAALVIAAFILMRRLNKKGAK